jgi:sensor histidine kinase YesM
MKHPVLFHRNRLIIWWLVGLFLIAGQSLLFYFAYGNLDKTGIFDSVFSLIIFSAMALSFWYPFGFFNSGSIRTLTLISNLIISGTIIIAIWILLTKSFLQGIIQEQNIFDEYWKITFLYRIGAGVFLFGITVLVYYLFISISNLSEKNAREAKLESLVKETELKMLRSQINPHFLFNSLNSISALTVSNPEKARDMVIKLSDFMRYSLARKDDLPVSFKSELDSLRLYLDIEKVRFGKKLIIEEQIEESCLNVMIPAMTLQPLYENAVKHGVYESVESVVIKTIATLIDGFLNIEISNNYDLDSTSHKGTGTGLSNVSRRLELFYGHKSSMTYSKENGIFKVSIIIPV